MILRHFIILSENKRQQKYSVPLQASFTFIIIILRIKYPISKTRNILSRTSIYSGLTIQQVRIGSIFNYKIL